MSRKIGSNRAAFHHRATLGAADIRALRQDDAAAVRRVIQDAFAGQDASLDPPQSALRETAESLARQIAATGGAAAEARGEVIACVLWREEAGGLYLGRLAVTAAWRRHGLARRLIGAAEAEARSRGLACLRPSTRLALAGNRALFAACGFVEIRREAHPGYNRPTTVTLERSL